MLVRSSFLKDFHGPNCIIGSSKRQGLGFERPYASHSPVHVFFDNSFLLIAIGFTLICKWPLSSQRGKGVNHGIHRSQKGILHRPSNQVYRSGLTCETGKFGYGFKPTGRSPWFNSGSPQFDPIRSDRNIDRLLNSSAKGVSHRTEAGTDFGEHTSHCPRPFRWGIGCTMVAEH